MIDNYYKYFLINKFSTFSYNILTKINKQLLIFWTFIYKSYF